MRNKTISGKDLFWLGIGTYGIGGRGHRDLQLTEKQEDEKYIEALLFSLEKGMNFSEISLGYGHGNAARLFSQTIYGSKIGRKDLFLTNSIYPRDFDKYEEVEKDIDRMYEVFNTDYFDSTLVTQSLVSKYGKENVYTTLNSLLKSGRTRFVSLSNSSKDFIRDFHKEFGDKFHAHETNLAFEMRLNQDEGIFDLCNSLNVLNVIWRPLRRNLTAQKNWDILIELSEKYDKTQNQIILNWIKHLGYLPMVMSSSIEHIKENISAGNFTMEDIDYIRINRFRADNLNTPKIDWERTGEGVSMATFACSLDEYFK